MKPPTSHPSDKNSSGNQSYKSGGAASQPNIGLTPFQLSAKPNGKQSAGQRQNQRDKPNSFRKAVGRLLSGVRSSSKDMTKTTDSSIGANPVGVAALKVNQSKNEDQLALQVSHSPRNHIVEI